ncbi:MAG: putative oxidoreductase YteT [Haliscomenobacter sp.]|nr:putative oxidoreductase YteT [Haliscomenobacter sp.]
MDRRHFILTAGAAAGGMMVSPSGALAHLAQSGKKIRMAMVGTGVRGISMWGKDVLAEYGRLVEFVGLSDINPGRLDYAKKYMQVACPTYTNFDEMMRQAKPDALMVTTVDATHDEFIVKGLEQGVHVITEKPMTTDEVKCQSILDAERRTGNKITVAFNYRYSPHRLKIYQLLREGAVGKITSVDFHWYLNTSHGADYFRRWHRLRSKGGSLLLHKSTHHFDLVNWWLESEPFEVFAYGKLEHYGKNNSFRSTHCRACPHTANCKFFWDMTKNEHLMNLYAANEGHDGYLRDGCVWKEDINIFDKMAVTVKYANDVQMSYSLTTYSPYEGYRIAFNGTGGRLEAWIKESQPWEAEPFDELRLTKNFGQTELIQIPHRQGGHGGGDKLMKDKIFGVTPEDPYRQSAGSRDGAMSILTGIAARKSIDTGLPVKIGSLTSLQPGAERG